MTYFNTLMPFTPVEKEEIVKSFTYKKIKRRELILQEGQVCKHYSFVVSGCFKMYGIDDKATEHNIQFTAENDWIMDIGSFHSKKESKLYIEAIEPSVILQIEQNELYHLYLNIPKLNRIFKVIVENKFVELQNRVLQNFSSSAETRYLSFLEQYPQLSNRIPNAQIASYLGITPEFLSKIRNGLSKKSPNS